MNQSRGFGILALTVLCLAALKAGGQGAEGHGTAPAAMALPETICWKAGAPGKPHGDLYLEILGAKDKLSVRLI